MKEKNLQNNPLLEKSKLKYNAVPFDKIKKEHFLPALESEISKAKAKIEKIKNSREKPNFENTILELELVSSKIGLISNIFFNIMNAESDNEFKNLAQKISPMIMEFYTSISTDETLFNKVKFVYENIDKFTDNPEDKRLTEIIYKNFIRNGALLTSEKKKRLKEIDKELSILSPKFSQNVLNSMNEFEILITNEEELSGIPETAKESARKMAEKKGKKGWLFNLQYPSMMPILMYADNRELRKKIYIANLQKSITGEFDNREIIKKIVKLRIERAKLLGYETHADYVLEERMAKNRKTVEKFLNRLYEVSKPKAINEKEMLEKFAKETDGIDTLYVWDWRYYGEKLKKKLFNFDEEELRPYFKMENVINGIFKVANKLYGLNFIKNNELPVYHEDVEVFEVFDENNEFLGLFYLDLFPRETKRSGAWMTTYVQQGLYDDGMRRPHVSIVANLTRSTETKPSLLLLREVQTIFHEFGHALHALLSNCKYKSLSSPNVYWDFVELPSQIMENWLYEKETLDLFAYHYKTGEKIPETLIEKIKESRKFLAANFMLRQLKFGFIDMKWHTLSEFDDKIDVFKFENEISKKFEIFKEPDEIVNISCSFGHIFSGGYSSGYYSYKWAEVLEADAFELFKEKGIFNREIANSFRKNILEKGNTEHPMNLYIKFRGREPDPDALLRRDGLL